MGEGEDANPMNRRFLNWNSVAAVAVVVVCLGYWFFIGFRYPSQRANFGFGPDWNCTYFGKGDPVCVKKPPN